MFRLKVLIWILLISSAISACKKDFDYSKYYTIKDQKLSYSDTLKYSFIPTTTKNYRVYLSIRYSDIYQFNNLWCKISDDRGLFRVDIPLFDKMGKPLGKCTGGVCTQTVLWKESRFAANDTVQWSVNQNMRVNPLENISEIGIIVKTDTAQ